MRTVDIKLKAAPGHRAIQRLAFLCRMADAEVLEETSAVWTVQVPDDRLDLLIDSLHDARGVRQVRTRPVPPLTDC